MVYDPINTHYTIVNILLHVSFIFGFHPTYSSSTFLPDWSLGLEMQFYLAFPLILLAMRRFGAARICIGLAFLSYAVIWGLMRAAMAGKMSIFYEPSLLFFRLPIFLAGMLLFEAGRTESPWLRAVYITLSGLFCARMSTAYGWQILWLLVPLVLMAVMIVPSRKVVSQLDWLQRACHSRAVTLMSEVSYSVYLFHGFVLAIVGSRIGHAAKDANLPLGVGTAAIWLAVIPLTYSFAYVVYRSIELPGMRLAAGLLSLKPSVAKSSA